MKEQTIVGITKVKHPQNQSEIEAALFYLLNQMKERNKIKIPTKKANVMIKPNICQVRSYETGVSVDPFIVKCLVDWLLQNYHIEEITIGEADATELNVEVAFKVLGWEDTFNQYPNVRLLNLTKDEYVDVTLNGLYFKKKIGNVQIIHEIRFFNFFCEIEDAYHNRNHMQS